MQNVATETRTGTEENIRHLDYFRSKDRRDISGSSLATYCQYDELQTFCRLSTREQINLRDL